MRVKGSRGHRGNLLPAIVARHHIFAVSVIINIVMAVVVVVLPPTRRLGSALSILTRYAAVAVLREKRTTPISRQIP